MDWLQMEHGVLNELIWPPCLHSQDYHQANGNGSAQIIMGKAQPLEDWCWVFWFVQSQMGPRSYIELWVRRNRTNCRPYYPDTPNTSGTTGIYGLTILNGDTKCCVNAITARIWLRQRGNTPCCTAYLGVDVLPKEKEDFIAISNFPIVCGKPMFSLDMLVRKNVHIITSFKA